MTQEEYKKELDKLTKEYEAKESGLAKQYAFSNNPYKVGDIVSDHQGSIKIETIKYTKGGFLNEFPMCVYYGIELKKDLTPRKDGSKRQVWQSNIKHN